MYRSVFFYFEGLESPFVNPESFEIDDYDQFDIRTT
jgi:hypothetical protein